MTTERGEVWGYATGEEPDMWGSAESREEAIELALEAAEDEGKAEAWIVRGKWAQGHKYLPDPDQFIEQIQDIAIDNGCPDGIDEPFDSMWWEATGTPERVTKESVAT